MLFKLYIVLFKWFIHCSFIGLSIKTPNAMAQIHASWDENWLGLSFFSLDVIFKIYSILLIHWSIISQSIKSLNGSITSGLDQDARSAESDQTQEVEPGEDKYFNLD